MIELAHLAECGALTFIRGVWGVQRAARPLVGLAPSFRGGPCLTPGSVRRLFIRGGRAAGRQVTLVAHPPLGIKAVSRGGLLGKETMSNKSKAEGGPGRWVNDRVAGGLPNPMAGILQGKGSPSPGGRERGPGWPEL